MPLLTADLGEALDALPRLPFAVVVLQRVDQLAHQARGQVHARHNHAGHLELLDLVVDAGEGDAELVVRVGHVREVRVVPCHHLRRGLQVDVALGLLLSHPVVVSRTCGTSCWRSDGCARPSPTTWSTTAGCSPARPASSSSRCARTSAWSGGSPSATTSSSSTSGARRTPRR